MTDEHEAHHYHNDFPVRDDDYDCPQGLPKAWDMESPHYEQWQDAIAQADLKVTETL